MDFQSGARPRRGSPLISVTGARSRGQKLPSRRRGSRNSRPLGTEVGRLLSRPTLVFIPFEFYLKWLSYGHLFVGAVVSWALVAWAVMDISVDG